eukprot:Skav201369  [mRNA]  locus=scaffold176:331670:339502:+ [translate_table: standard]
MTIFRRRGLFGRLQSSCQELVFILICLCSSQSSRILLAFLLGSMILRGTQLVVGQGLLFLNTGWLRLRQASWA